MILFIFISVLFIGQFFLAWYYLAEGRSNKSVGDGDLIRELSIIIPFKDEEHRIAPLLESINELQIPAELVVELIFINDKSSDNTVNLIESMVHGKFVIINSEGNGKKAAIKAGVQKARFDSVLSWDADIIVSSGFLNEIIELAKADMWILPVQMTGKELIENLGAIEFSWLQIFTFSGAQNGKASLCNAANLLFSKEAFLEVEPARDDLEIASGDDHFLLKELMNLGKDVRAIVHPQLEVVTQAPISFGSLLNQRKRWITKLSLSDVPAYLLPLISLVLLSSSNFIAMMVIGKIGFIFFLVLFKFAADYAVQRMYKRRNLSKEELAAVFFHQFWYPVFLVALLFHDNRQDKRWTP